MSGSSKHKLTITVGWEQYTFAEQEIKIDWSRKESIC